MRTKENYYQSSPQELDDNLKKLSIKEKDWILKQIKENHYVFTTFEKVMLSCEPHFEVLDPQNDFVKFIKYGGEK